MCSDTLTASKEGIYLDLETYYHSIYLRYLFGKLAVWVRRMSSRICVCMLLVALPSVFGICPYGMTSEDGYGACYTLYQVRTVGAVSCHCAAGPLRRCCLAAFAAAFEVSYDAIYMVLLELIPTSHASPPCARVRTSTGKLHVGGGTEQVYVYRPARQPGNNSRHAYVHVRIKLVVSLRSVVIQSFKVLLDRTTRYLRDPGGACR